MFSAVLGLRPVSSHRPSRTAMPTPNHRRSTPRVEALEDRTLLTAADVTVLGAAAGGGPEVRVLNADGSQRFAFYVYDQSFTGGVRVATADVNRDGVPDIITAPGPGGGSEIRVFDGSTGKPLAGPLGGFYAFDPAFTGGVTVAAGDINNDGKADIIVGAGPGGGPDVKVFSGADGSLLLAFVAYDPAFTGGLNVAAGTVRGDGRADVITAPQSGGGPQVKVFLPDGTLYQTFMAYDPAFRGGVSVASGDLNGDGCSDLVTGAGAGGGPEVRTFSGVDDAAISSFYAFDPAFTGGIDVAVCYPGDTTSPSIMAAAGTGGSPQVRTFDPNTLRAVDTYFAFDQRFTGGVSAAGDPATAGDAVLTWNKIELRAVLAIAPQPPQVSRDLAMVSSAVYEAVNAIDGSSADYHSHLSAPAGASETVAASVAADAVLDSLFPTLAATFDADLTAQLAVVPDGAGKSGGIVVGQAAANDILTWRANDGANRVVPYTVGSGPGVYQLTPPAFKPVVDPQWPQLTPFAMTSDTQFRPGPPPAVTSQAYADAYNEVMAYGGTASTARTAEQTLIAHFWADLPGASVTPPGHWDEIAAQVSTTQHLSLVQNARLFALLNISLADAAVVAWDAKNAYNFWRPVTAIQQGNNDGNPNTTGDPTWTPLWATPAFQSYTSGHSSFSSAAAAVLTAVLGNVSFRTSSDDVPGAVRQYANFTAAAAEAGQSRIYGGIHFQFDNQAGLAGGGALGTYVVRNFLQPK